MTYFGFRGKSLYFSRSIETLIRIGAVDISPIFSLEEVLHVRNIEQD